MSIVALGASVTFGDGSPLPGAPTTEFPVTLRQSVTAGKTAVGSKVEAELVIATMFNGAVIPRSAILSGEVTESVAKTKTEPSRLAIRMDSARWKNGSTAIKLYLTEWYYPDATNQDLASRPPDEAGGNRSLNGPGSYPYPNPDPNQSGNSSTSPRYPGARSGDEQTGSPLPAPAAGLSPHRSPIKNIEATHNSDGTIVLTSSRMNIKLDRATTYVVAGSGLP